MLTYVLIYLASSVAGLIALSVMILQIGKLMGGCPDSKRVARAAAVTIATGYAAIGSGMILLLGTIVVAFVPSPITGVFLALGAVILGLGLGFSHAIATLRQVVEETSIPAHQNTPVAA